VKIDMYHTRKNICVMVMVCRVLLLKSPEVVLNSSPNIALSLLSKLTYLSMPQPHWRDVIMQTSGKTGQKHRLASNGCTNHTT
jgi:hypothetical protein